MKPKFAISETIYWSSLSAVVIALFVFQCRIVINHDVAYYLFAAEKLLAGGSIPDSIYDINPPLVTFLNVPPVAVAHLLAAPTALVFAAYIFSLTFLSFSCAIWALRSAALLPAVDLRIGLLFVISLAAAGYDFGQREHLICILCLPYLCVVASRLAGNVPSTQASIVCVTLASLGFLLKPQFFVLPFAVLIADLVRDRDRRHLTSVENLTFLVNVLCYATIVLIFFSEWLSLAADSAHAMRYFNVSLGATARPALNALVVGGVCAILIVNLARGRFEEQLAWMILLLLATGTLSYIIQNRGWTYHWLPARLALALLYGLIVGFCLEATRKKRLSDLAAVILFMSATGGIAVTALTSLANGLQENSTVAKREQPLSQLIRNEAPNRYIMVLSTSAKLLSAAMVADAKWGSRFIALQELPFVNDNLDKLATLDSSQADRVRRLDRFLKSSVTEDIEHYRPYLIFVEMDPGKIGLHRLDIDLVRYLSEYGPFSEQWANYVPYTDDKMPKGIAVEEDRPFAVFRRRS
jgi:hypothetical protein